MPRYVQFHAKRRRYVDPFDVVRRMLTLPPMPMARLRPGGAPPQLIDAAIAPALRHTPMAEDPRAEAEHFFSGRPRP